MSPGSTEKFLGLPGSGQPHFGTLKKKMPGKKIKEKKKKKNLELDSSELGTANIRVIFIEL